MRKLLYVPLLALALLTPMSIMSVAHAEESATATLAPAHNDQGTWANPLEIELHRFDYVAHAGAGCTLDNHFVELHATTFGDHPILEFADNHFVDMRAVLPESPGEDHHLMRIGLYEADNYLSMIDFYDNGSADQRNVPLLC